MLRLAGRTAGVFLRERALRHGCGSLRNFFEHQRVPGGMPIRMRSDNADVFGRFEPGSPERSLASRLVFAAREQPWSTACL